MNKKAITNSNAKSKHKEFLELSYKDRLSFWDAHRLLVYETKYTMNSCEFSIRPINVEETEIYYNWRENKEKSIIPELYCDRLISVYENGLKKCKSPIDFTESQIINVEEKFNERIDQSNVGTHYIGLVKHDALIEGRKFWKENNYPNILTTKSDLAVQYFIHGRELMDFSKYLREKLEVLKNTKTVTKPHNQKPLYTYNWQRNPMIELPELYRRMKGGFIADTTDKKDFIAVFSHVPVHEIKNKIEWVHTQKNLLAYFLDQLRTKDKIPLASEIWAIAKNCFIEANNLKQIKVLYDNNKNEKNLHKPKDYFLIDQLFENLSPKPVKGSSL